MGFLKFLNRDKSRQRSTIDNLDMPPPPPEGMPMGSKDDLGPLPQFPESDPFAAKEYSTTELDDLSSKPQHHDDYQTPPVTDKPLELPTFDQPKQARPLFPRSLKKRESIKSSQEDMYDVKQSHYDQSQSQAFMEGKDLLEHRRIHKGPIYVKIDRFRNIFDGISEVRVLLKKTADSVQLAVDKEMTKEKDYERLKVSVIDIQKKLLFVEQTIFKGD